MEPQNSLFPPSTEKDCESSEDERDLLRARNHSLIDDEISNDESQNSSPSKESFGSETRDTGSRKRSASDAQLTGFFRKGTRFKALFDDAVAKMVSNSGRSDTVESTTTNSIQHSHLSKDLQDEAGAVQDKTAKIILLQKELDKVTVESSAVEAANKELRQSLKDVEQRLERTTNALRVAGQNASNARVDADAAEATAASLASQLEAFRVVVDETKRASLVLYQEHEEISSAAQSMETKYVQAQADLCRSQNLRQQVEKQKEELDAKVQMMKTERRELEVQVSNHTAEAQKWKRSWEETKALELAQKARTRQVESELQQAEAVLVDASSRAAEAEASADILKETIAELTAANSELHDRFKQQRELHREEQEKLQASLRNAQQESQTLGLQCTTFKGEVDRLTNENSSLEKRVEQMQSRINKLERRLNDSSNSWVAPGIGGPSTSDQVVAPSQAKSDKENSSGTPRPSCSICLKPPVGIMKRCQCGTKGCNYRAHATCINRIQAGPSVAHPGTPASLLPVVLCKSQSSWVRHK